MTAEIKLPDPTQLPPTVLTPDGGNINTGPVWKKFVVPYTAFAVAALSTDIELFVLSPAEVILASLIKHMTSFSGGSITAYTLSIGITGSLAKYHADFDVFQATGDAVFSFVDSSAGLETFGGPTSIKIEAEATDGDLDTATAGVADIWVLTSKPPL